MNLCNEYPKTEILLRVFGTCYVSHIMASLDGLDILRDFNHGTSTVSNPEQGWPVSA